MSKSTTRDRATVPTPSSLPPTPILEQKSLEFVDAKGVRDECDFSVRRDGPWCVFDGKVDSLSTKTALFAMVPEVDGAMWIVDKLRTGRGGKR